MSPQGQTFRCHACGTLNPAGAEWCSNCGRNLESGEDPRRQQESSKPSRVKRMVYHNLVGRHVSNAIGYLILLIIIAGIVVLLLVF